MPYVKACLGDEMMDGIRLLRPLALVTVLLCILMTAASAVPPLPAEFFGSVSVGGVPAAAGTTLVAKINDQVRGQAVITTPGQYGGSGIFDNKLVIAVTEDDLKSGTPTITFFIGDVKADQSVQYQQGSAGRLDLTSGGVCNIVAEFSGAPLSGDVPLTVQFTDMSSGKPTMWAWDFGNGGTDMVANPVHVYKTAGTYTVKLTASSQTGGSNTRVKEGYVKAGKSGQGPKAAFTVDKRSGPVPLTVQFTDRSSGNPTMWAWDFGDGGTDMMANPVHTYKNAGIYTVSLTASNTLGSDKKTEPDYISVTGDIPPPVAMFEASPLSGNAPLEVKFKDLSLGPPTSYAWDFGDGTTSAEPNPVHVYTTGTYTVKLTVRDSGGSQTMKRDNYITVGPSSGINADFSANPTSGNIPLTVQFKDLSSGKPTMWAWDFGDGETDMVANPLHIYQKPGMYNVKLTASSQTGGSSTKVRNGYINVGPSGGINADFSANPTTGMPPLAVQFKDLSSGKPTMWAWDFGDGGTDMVANPLHIYQKPGMYNVKLTASSQTGGSSTKVRNGYINVGPSGGIVADFIGSPTAGGTPLAVQFNDRSKGGPIMWAWDFGDGTSDIVANPLHVYAKPGRYTVKLVASNQVSSSTAVKPDYISVQGPPAPGSGVIRIIYAPDRSTVYVDNIRVGETKFLQTFVIGNLQPGNHQLKVTKPGFVDYIITVPVRYDRSTDVIADMRLQPTPNGILSVYTYPKGSSVFVDGNPVGNGPVWLADVRPGIHLVRVTSPGYLEWSQMVEIRGGGSVSYITAALYPSWWTPLYGYVMISSIPGHGAAFLDGVPVGSTPVTLSQVAPGDHTVRIDLQGYQPWEQVVKVMEGRTAYVVAQMTGGGSPVIPASTGSSPEITEAAVSI